MQGFGQPSPPFERSFRMDRAIDYFLIQISANDAQRLLVERMRCSNARARYSAKPMACAR